MVLAPNTTSQQGESGAAPPPPGDCNEEIDLLLEPCSSIAICRAAPGQVRD